MGVDGSSKHKQGGKRQRPIEDPPVQSQSRRPSEQNRKPPHSVDSRPSNPAQSDRPGGLVYSLVPSLETERSPTSVQSSRREDGKPPLPEQSGLPPSPDGKPIQSRKPLPAVNGVSPISGQTNRTSLPASQAGRQGRPSSLADGRPTYSNKTPQLESGRPTQHRKLPFAERSGMQNPDDTRQITGAKSNMSSLQTHSTEPVPPKGYMGHLPSNSRSASPIQIEQAYPNRKTVIIRRSSKGSALGSIPGSMRGSIPGSVRGSLAAKSSTRVAELESVSDDSEEANARLYKIKEGFCFLLLIVGIVLFSYSLYYYIVGKCPFGLHQCPGGACVLLHQVCDGKFDCKDRSDESNCSKY